RVRRGSLRVARYVDPGQGPRVAVVTGAGSGIGRAIAAALYRAGMKVALLGRRRGLLEETRRLIEAPRAGGRPRGGSAAGRVLAVPVDVSNRAAAGRAIRRIEKAWGRLDILVNNAGTNTPRRSLEEISPEDWDQVLAVNLTGVYNVTRAALPALRKSGSGHVINIGSISGLRASKVAGIAYTSSKHAVQGFTATIAIEERAHGIRATVIHPGEVDTPILERRPAPVSAERRKVMLRPEDVAETVLFAATRPPRVSLPLIIVEPTAQDF
ncbi:MAG TPA: SDR family oxidoreductase, partial [Planctomycetota bacterium]|nr:SDR family oxidoreductase [Planctomycetota bacterium]